MLLDLALGHQRQIVKGRGWNAHFLKLLLRVRLDREGQLDLALQWDLIWVLGWTMAWMMVASLQL